MYLSDEDNIRELFKQCIWNAGWQLKEERELLLKKLDKKDLERLQEVAEEQKKELEKLRKTAEEQQRQSAKQGEILVEISQGVSLLVDFVNTELKNFLAREKKSSISRTIRIVMIQ